MSYIRTKWIKGYPYLYEQESYREGNKVKTRFIRYVGKASPETAGRTAEPTMQAGTEELLVKVTGVNQSLDKLADYLMTDKQSIKRILGDFIDYATISTKSDTQVDDIAQRFIKNGENAIDAYQQTMRQYEALTDSDSLKIVAEMKKALTTFTKQLNKLRTAKTKVDKALALDALISAEHSRGGKFLTHAYGIEDIDRGDYFLGNIMDWLRNQTEFSPQQLQGFYNQATGNMAGDRLNDLDTKLKATGWRGI